MTNGIHIQADIWVSDVVHREPEENSRASKMGLSLRQFSLVAHKHVLNKRCLVITLDFTEGLS